MATIEDRMRVLVAPFLTDLQLDLYDLEYAGGVIRVTVDKAGGVDMESISLATRLISRELDHQDPINGHYTLEVSSPGLERNLRTPSHFQRIIGWKVNVRTNANVAGDRRAQGVLTFADHHGIAVAVTVGKETVERRLAYSEIDRAKTVFEWEKTAKADAVAPRVKPVVKPVAKRTKQESSPGKAAP
jgi:ribosome maturation factor RimP